MELERDRDGKLGAVADVGLEIRQCRGCSGKTRPIQGSSGNIVGTDEAGVGLGVIVVVDWVAEKTWDE